MRKLWIFLLSFSITSLVIVLSSSSVSAYHQGDVLGVASAQTLSIPPTAEGPGLILPDSPLFFLDRLKQQVRLLLAFTPEQKSKIHAAIAGERLAELQIMLAKNNTAGVRVDLQGVSDNLKAASQDLDNAKLTGRNINLLAKEINDSIKEKESKLSVLESKATGETKAQVRGAREALKVAKVKAEDNLPADLLKNEVEDDLNREIEDHINNATGSAKGINRAIDVLTRLASEAASENKTHREKALKHAIEVKNDALRKQEEKLIEAENKAQEKLMKAKEKAFEQARKAVNRIKEAVQNLQEAQKAVVEIRSTSGKTSNSGPPEKSSGGSSENKSSGGDHGGSSGDSGKSGSGDSGKSGGEKK